MHTPVIFMPFDWWLAFEKLLRLNELLNGHKPGHEIPKCKKWAQEGTHIQYTSVVPYPWLIQLVNQELGTTDITVTV